LSGRRDRRGAGRHAALVAAGILLSRVIGLVRTRIFAHYFGLRSDAADAFSAAFRIPNFLQNLFGEGVLSASFIPVYARLVAEGDEEESGRVAGAVAAILALTTSVLVLAGVAATPLLIDLIAPGFGGAKRDLTIRIVRILFPGAGLLVLSAWCLGILNSHRRFFLSYSAPVVWNTAMIATLLGFGGTTGQDRLALLLAWGSVAGSALQLGVQIPVVVRLVRRLRFAFDWRMPAVRTVLRNFGPVFVGRGVVQISAYIDALLASLLPTGAVTGLTNAQLLYTLPVSLFGMSVSAAELPAMSSALGAEAEVAAYLRGRLAAAARRIAFFVAPSAVGFIVLGDVIAAALLQTGRFTRADAVYVWGILAAFGPGLLASTLGRLYSSTFYALRDTRTPLRCATVHVVVSTTLGYLFAIPLGWGVPGLAGAAAAGGWIEFVLLRRSLRARIGPAGIPAPVLAKLWGAAVLAAGAAWAARAVAGTAHPLLAAGAILGPFGLVYAGATLALRVEEARSLLRRAPGVRSPQST
jgi:putative peptidoglycan lipid II flippase